jgi:hypothetical protein
MPSSVAVRPMTARPGRAGGEDLDREQAGRRWIGGKELQGAAQGQPRLGLRGRARPAGDVDLGHQPTVQLPEGGLDTIVEAVELGVEGGARDPGAPDDVPHRGRRVALLGGDLGGGGNQAIALIARDQLGGNSVRAAREAPRTAFAGT